MNSMELPAFCWISSSRFIQDWARVWVGEPGSSWDLYSQWAAMPLLAIASISSVRI